MTGPAALAIGFAAATLGGAAFAAGAASAVEAPITGSATVIEGDVFEVAGTRIRLFGIDAPELDQSCEWPNAGTIPCGEIARTALMDLTAGATVTCRTRTGAASAPGEITAVCHAGLTDVGWNMVHTGWALAARDVTADYVAKEEEARRGRRGLWRGAFVPPWIWRERKERALKGEAAAVPEVCILGVVEAGVECLGFRSADGHMFALPGASEGLVAGVRACICGKPAELSFCMRGSPLSASRIEDVRACGAPSR
ncbi:MAG: thermonuclease family protein [Rhodospirillales bacterium]|jgi:endonuclease YncB( thermonuclease family)|nr:thermonuclease family protein [Rhodospirillales bacterium]